MAYNPLNPNGRSAAADSQPQTLSNEDFAEVQAINTKLDNVIAALGNVDDNTANIHLDVADAYNNTAHALTWGTQSEPAASTDTATVPYIGLFKRLLQRITTLIGLFPTALSGSGNFKTAISEAIPAGTNNIGDVDIVSQAQAYGADTSLAVTALNSLASSATAGWKSARVSNLSTKASDYLIGVKLTMANTTPASDKAVYVYVCPWFTTDGGSTWYASSGGTTTLPTDGDAAYTIASPNDLRLLGVLSYTAQNQVLQSVWPLSKCFGNKLPHGFSIIIVNFSGAAISGSGNIVYHQPIT